MKSSLMYKQSGLKISDHRTRIIAVHNHGGVVNFAKLTEVLHEIFSPRVERKISDVQLGAAVCSSWTVSRFVRTTVVPAPWGALGP